MVLFRYHFLHFSPITTGFFDLKYICLGFILSIDKNDDLVLFRYRFFIQEKILFDRICPMILRIITDHLQYIFPQLKQFPDAPLDFFLDFQ